LYSAVLDPGRDCRVLLLACRFRAGPAGAQRRANGVLQRQAGRTRYGASAPVLFSAPLASTLYRDTILFYWVVPPEQACAALRDLLQMLDRSVAALRRHRLEASTQFALHTARF